MKRFFAITLAFLMLAFCACTPKTEYDESLIIGRRSSAVIEKYGEFDLVLDPQKLIDGEYRNISCGYLTAEGEYFMISFDQNGIAFKIQADVAIED